jgi:hypothetical protein
MKRPGFRRLLWLGKRAVLLIPDSALIEKIEKEEKDKGFPFKIIGLASVAVGAAALGLYLGREFRSRYKFNGRRMTGLLMPAISGRLWVSLGWGFSVLSLPHHLLDLERES